MKKLIFFCSIFFYQISTAQILPTTTYNIEDFELFKSYEFYGYNLDGNCHKNVSISLTFINTIDTIKDYTFGDIYYDITFKYYADNQLIASFKPDVITTFSGEHNFFGHYTLDLSYETYKVEAILQEFRLVGYPDMMSYEPIGPKYTTNSNFLKTCPFVDSDGDGVIDTNDKCPGYDDSIDTDNDGIPNGCDICEGYDDKADVDNDGIPDGCDPINNNELKPNLTLSKVTVKVGSTTYDTSSTDNSKTIPIFKNGEQHTFNVTIKNNDNGNATSSNYKLLVSEGTDYPNIGTKPVYQFGSSHNAGGIVGNSEKTSSFSEYIYDQISLLNLVENKTYYMFVDIDPDNIVDESNETINDNIAYFSFKYKNTTTGRIFIKTSSLSNKTVLEYDYLPTTNNFKVYDLQYNILRYSVNIYEQFSTVDLSKLPSGLYALHVNGTYIKKIGIMNDSSSPLYPK